MDKANSVETNMGIMAEKISNIEKVMTAIQAALDTVLKNYVQREEFETRFVRLQAEIDKRMEGSHKRIDMCTTKEEHIESLRVLKENYIESLKPIKSDIAELKDDKKWLYRLVYTIILTAIIGLIINIK